MGNSVAWEKLRFKELGRGKSGAKLCSSSHYLGKAAIVQLSQKLSQVKDSRRAGRQSHRAAPLAAFSWLATVIKREAIAQRPSDVLLEAVTSRAAITESAERRHSPWTRVPPGLIS